MSFSYFYSQQEGIIYPRNKPASFQENLFSPWTSVPVCISLLGTASDEGQYHTNAETEMKWNNVWTFMYLSRNYSLNTTKQKMSLWNKTHSFFLFSSTGLSLFTLVYVQLGGRQNFSCSVNGKCYNFSFTVNLCNLDFQLYWILF